MVHTFGIVALIILAGALGGLTRAYLADRRADRRF